MVNFTLKTHVVAASILLTSIATAQDTLETLTEEMNKPTDFQLYSQEIKEGLEKKGAIIGIKELPISKLYFVEAEQGTYLVSQDGRFVIDGVIKDVWHRKTLRELADTKGIDRVPFAANADKMDKFLATYTLGDPSTPRAGGIFVDPFAEITVTALQKLQELSTDKHWLVILMPLVHGNKALDRAKRIWCAEDQEAAKQDLINGTSLSFADLKSDCEDTKVVSSQLVTNLFNIKELPHVIREDGLSASGFPVEFDNWLKQP